MRLDDQDAEVPEVVMPGGGQSQPVFDTGALLIRAGYHIKRKGEISGASGHWTDDHKIAFAQHGREPRLRVPPARNKTQCRLVSVDAAIVRWCAQRTAHVRAE